MEIATAVESNFFYENWLNIVFGLIGLAGTLFGCLSYYKSKQQEIVFDYLFKAAEKNIDRDIKDEDIENKKREIDDHANRIIELQDRIKNDIPREARKAVLRDRYEVQKVHLNEIYQSIMTTQSSLNEIGENMSIPHEIKDYIEREIVPEYKLREKRENYKNVLVVTTTAMAISGYLPFYPFSWMSTLFFAVISFLVILLITLSNINFWKFHFYKIKNEIGYHGIIFLSSIILLLVIMAISNLENLTYIHRDLIIFAFILGVFGILVSAIIYAWIRVRKLLVGETLGEETNG